MNHYLARVVSPLLIASNFIRSAFNGLIGSEDEEGANLSQRRELFEYLWNCYSNAVYDRLHYRGSLDYVNRTLGEAAADDLAGFFNPVERQVETYVQNVFNGSFGDEIQIAPDVITASGRKDQVNPAILEPLQQIFNWSNLNIESKLFVRYGAIFGTTGIRVVARVGRDYPNDRLEDRRVYLQFEHAGSIVGMQQDARGNVSQLLTEHTRRSGDLDVNDGEQEIEVFKIRILATKDRFQTFRQSTGFGGFGGGDFDIPYDDANAQDNGKLADYPNALKVVPYVIAHHKRLGGQWGAWSFFGQMQKIDRLNALLAHIDRQIYRHVKVVYLVSGKGKAPQEIDFSGGKILYHRKRGDDDSKLDIQALVSNLNLADAISQAKLQISEIRDSMPELKATDGDFLSNQSGETVAHLRTPAEQRILEARTLYEDALIRACKIGLSYGIMLGLWSKQLKVMPDAAGAEQAFRTGLLDFRFNNRPALPLTAKESLELRQMEADLSTAEEEARINAAANALDTPPPQTTASGSNGSSSFIA